MPHPKRRSTTFLVSQPAVYSRRRLHFPRYGFGTGIHQFGGSIWAGAPPVMDPRVLRYLQQKAKVQKGGSYARKRSLRSSRRKKRSKRKRRQ